MDAFYASCEQRDHPELSGKPVVVGGQPGSRGVVAAASYEARQFGIHSAMPSHRAARLCPQAIFMKPRFQVYRQVSRKIMDILREYTDLVEPLSLDEAYLDVTQNKKNMRYATEIAKEIRQRIYLETKLTASAGVAPNKFMAKVASDMNKPNGLTVITPKNLPSILKELPVRKIPGIGPVTEKRMIRLGIRTVGELRQRTEKKLRKSFGKLGSWYFRIARGKDDRLVKPNRKRKSLGAERTFSHNLIDPIHLEEKLSELSEEVSRRLKNAGIKGKTLTLKITYHDFRKITRSETANDWLWDKELLTEKAMTLMRSTEAGKTPLRLLGIQVSNLNNQSRPSRTPHKRQIEFPF